MTTRFRDGSVTCELDDGLDRFVRGLLSAGETETLAEIETAAGEVAQHADAEWYGPNGVTKDTGLTGDIGVVTTIDNVKGEIRVSVGSRDTRKAPKTGKPIPVYVHRPAATAMIRKQVTHEEYWAAPKGQRANYHPLPANPKTGFKGDTTPGPFLWVKSPKASDGKFLLAELVRKPAKAKVKLLAGNLGARIVRGARGGA